MRLRYFSSFIVLLLLTIGFLMVFNTTSAEILDKAFSSNYYIVFLKQLGFCLIGIFLGILIYFRGYQDILRLSAILFFIFSVLLIFVFIPGIGVEINGAKRWIGFKGWYIQPSEFVKYLIPIYFIQKQSQKGIPSNFKEFIKFNFVFIIPILLILFQPDNGTVFIISITFIVLFLMTKIKPIYWLLPFGVFCILGATIIWQVPYVKSRLKVYLNPESDIRGKGHQPYQAKIAIGSGKFLGRGLGQSLQKFNYLPEARSDYIAAIYAEEFGFVGMLILISIYLVLALCGFIFALKAYDIEGFYLAIILTFLISFQAFLNLGVVSGLLPSKGITLPFFSQGGSSLWVNIISFFLILSTSSCKKSIV